MESHPAEKTRDSLLTIAIPTYNRGAKLRRTLDLMGEQIAAAGAEGAVEILVSDNASSDNTQDVLRAVQAGNGRVRWIRQEQNLGFDGNVCQLLLACRTPYVWFFGDDDIPLEGCIRRIWERLAAVRPAVLLFSFVQPPGSTARTFRPDECTGGIWDPRQQIEMVSRFPKLSMFVLRREMSYADATQRFREICGSGYAFVSLALDALELGGQLELISEPLASCDGDFNVLRVEAGVWGGYARVFEHSFVSRVAPDLAERARRDSYLTLVSFLWAWRRGTVTLEAQVESDYWRTLITLRPQWNWLLRSPKVLLFFLVLKITPVYGPRLIGLASRLRRVAGNF